MLTFPLTLQDRLKQRLGGQDTLTAFAAMTHTHWSGYQSRIRMFRNGIEQTSALFEPNHDPRAQQIRMFETPLTINLNVRHYTIHLYILYIHVHLYFYTFKQYRQDQ